MSRYVLTSAVVRQPFHVAGLQARALVSYQQRPRPVDRSDIPVAWRAVYRGIGDGPAVRTDRAVLPRTSAVRGAGIAVHPDAGALVTARTAETVAAIARGVRAPWERG